MTQVERRLYLVTYDVACPKRWRKVFRLLHGYGQWLQLSVFECELTRDRRGKLERALRHRLDLTADRVLIAEIGRAPVAREQLGFLGAAPPPADHGPWVC